VLEVIIQSGLYGELSLPGAKLLSVLADVRDEQNEIHLSYPSLMDLTGIRSKGTFRAAIVELQDKHMVKVRKEILPGKKEAQNVYRLTLDDPELAELIDCTYRAHRYANEQERAWRAEIKKQRSHTKKPEACIT
jgi:hypothetical protein